MAGITWYEAVEIITPHVVRISTPRGTGTGFLISHGKNFPICGIATAAHVVDHAHYWEEPIRINHVHSSQTLLIRKDQRAILLDYDQDTAAILFSKGTIPFPQETLPLAPEGKRIKVGVEIGWLGFPAIPAAGLCFFSGRVSAWLEKQTAYLVDGVAINGVSGGPAFSLSGTGKENSPPMIMGVVSAYVPNRATGEALPGLSVVRNIAQFQRLAPTFASLDQAKSAEGPPPDLPPAPEGEASKSKEIPSRRDT